MTDAPLPTSLKKRNRAVGLILLTLILLVFGITIVKIEQAGTHPHPDDAGAVEMGAVHNSPVSPNGQ